MKCLMFTMLLVLSVQAQADGPGAGGGGQTCENRIQEIRDNIAGWIGTGAHEGLVYSDGLTAEIYKQKMLYYLGVEKQSNGSVLPRTAIECVHEPVKFNDYEKDCRFQNNGSGPKIICYYESFMDKKTMSEDDQYWLIHHEFAGLAEIEPPHGPNSSYKYSNQITGKLENVFVRRLPIADVKVANKKECNPTKEIKNKINLTAAEALLSPIKKDLEALDIKIDMSSVKLELSDTEFKARQTEYFVMFPRIKVTTSIIIGLTYYLRFLDQDGTPYALAGFQEGGSFLRINPTAYDKKGNLLTCQVTLDTGRDAESIYPANVPYLILNTNTNMVVWNCGYDKVKSNVPCKSGLPGKNLNPGQALFDF